MNILGLYLFICLLRVCFSVVLVVVVAAAAVAAAAVVVPVIDVNKVNFWRDRDSAFKLSLMHWCCA